MLRKILGACVVVFREVILLFTMTIRNLGLLWSRDGLEGHSKMLLFVESCWPFSVFCNGIKEPKHVLQVTYLHHQPPQCSTLPISPLDNVLPKLRNIRRDLCPNHWWNQVLAKNEFLFYFSFLETPFPEKTLLISLPSFLLEGITVWLPKPLSSLGRNKG